MALSLLDCYRLDRYEFEVFIGQLKFKHHDSKSVEKKNSEENNVQKSTEQQNDGEQNLVHKYTIRTVLSNVFKMDISNYDNESRNDEFEDQCSAYYNDVLETNSPFIGIVNKLRERYVVDERPVCNVQNVCYKIANEEYFVQNSKISAFNRGVVCIFTCVPRTLIQIIQMNPLQLTVYKDHDDDEQIEFGEASITMSGPVGFTDAIAHHFYENGNNPYSKTVEKTLEMISSNDGVTVVGNVTVRLKLTCHGLETIEEVVPISIMPDRPQLQPIFIEPFDFQFSRLIKQPPPKMMYNDVPKNKIEILNAEKKGKFLYCPSVQSPSGKEEKKASAFNTCLCKDLMENVKNILFDDHKRKHSACKSNSSNVRGAKKELTARFK